MTAKVTVYLQGMVTVNMSYLPVPMNSFTYGSWPVHRRMPDCVVALWWRSTSQRTSRRLPCSQAVHDGEWFQDRVWVNFDYYMVENCQHFASDNQSTSCDSSYVATDRCHGVSYV